MEHAQERQQSRDRADRTVSELAAGRDEEKENRNRRQHGKEHPNVRLGQPKRSDRQGCHVGIKNAVKRSRINQHGPAMRLLVTAPPERQSDNKYLHG